MPTYCIDIYGMMFMKTGHSTASKIDRRWNGKLWKLTFCLFWFHWKPLFFFNKTLGANHKTLHRLSQATVAHHPHLVRVQIVSTTVHHHQLLNVHHLKRHRVWTTTSTATIWSTTNISSRQRKSNESVTIRSLTQWTAWDHLISMRVAMGISERETMMIIMGKLFSSISFNIRLIDKNYSLQLQHNAELTRRQWTGWS